MYLKNLDFEQENHNLLYVTDLTNNPSYESICDANLSESQLIRLRNYFKVFGSNCYIKRNEDDFGKFDSRIDEGIFLGYSSTKKAYRCYNKIYTRL